MSAEVQMNPEEDGEQDAPLITWPRSQGQDQTIKITQRKSRAKDDH